MEISPKNRTRSPVEDVLLSAPERRATSFDTVASPILPENERPTALDESKVDIPVEELRRLANNHAGPIRRSRGRRLSRAFFGFLIAALVGAAATVAWQRHGDAADRIVKDWTVVSLNWLSSWRPQRRDTTTEKAASAVYRRTAGDDAVVPRTPLESAPGLIEKLDLMAANLAALKQSVDELSDKQEQLFAKIENLKTADQQIRPKVPQPHRHTPTASRRPDGGSASPQLLPAPPASSPTPAASVPRPPSVVGQGQ
jgi:hypothetical protein